MDTRICYNEENTLRIAKRFNNTKRSYLLVNPLQAKHMPVSPKESLHMMNALGAMVARKYPETSLVIGFAETATAVGAAVADAIGENCNYIHTTREKLPDGMDCVLFHEEHSHAVEQILCVEQFERWLNNTETVVFVDDEISTGKTLTNMVVRLKERFPILSQKTLVAVSILNRVSPENKQKMLDAGIHCGCLVRLPELDYTQIVKDFCIREAEKVRPMEEFAPDVVVSGVWGDPRVGLQISSYSKRVMQFAERFLELFADEMKQNPKILVLGTEECMYPALLLGKALEESQLDLTVRCHATTRSPIGICNTPGYPITAGNKIHSFYDSDRQAYIYNPDVYDAAIVVTDAPRAGDSMKDLASVFSGCKKWFFVHGGKHV